MKRFVLTFPTVTPLSQFEGGRALNYRVALVLGIGARNATRFLMLKPCPAAALALATIFLGGCVLVPPAGVGSNRDPIPTLIRASLVEIDRQIEPEQSGPFCDPQDPSPPATCPPSKDEKPR